jgi:ribonuclease H2 subunit A
MVYGCVVAPLRYKDALATGKYADSKTLTEPQRAALFSRVAADPDLAHAVDVLGAPTLSARMLGRSRASLNELACASTERLIRAALDAGCRLEEVYIDTVGDPERHRARMARAFPSVGLFVVQPRADSAFPVVSAASIVAKVTRDAAVGRLARLPGVREVLEEEGKEKEDEAGGGDAASARPPARLGCGYPSDPQTKRWLAAAAASGGPLLGFAPAPGNIVRFSWETAVRALDEAGVAVSMAFEADPPAEGGGGGGGAGGGRGGQTSLAALVAKPGGAAAAAAESCGVGRHSYFRIRRLERLAVL